MIVIRLQGGLGNQLFQFAFGHAASELTGRKLVFDTRLLRKIGAHAGFEFPLLGLPVEADTQEMLRCFPNWKVWVLEQLPKALQQEQGLWHEPALDDLQGLSNKALSLKGYWQTRKVSQEATDTVLNALHHLAKGAMAKDGTLHRILVEEYPVAVHIRRGDYLSSPKVQALFGPCPLSYFTQAMADFRAGHPNPRFFVFTDAPEWARGVFNGLQDVEVVRPSHDCSKSAVADLCRMVHCKAFVLSNSSLSWWAAHLAEQASSAETPEVIYPRPWFDAPGLLGISNGLPKLGWRGLEKAG